MVNNIGTKTDPRATQKQEDKRKTKHFRIGWESLNNKNSHPNQVFHS